MKTSKYASSAISSDAIARCVLDKFNSLEQKYKPRPRTDGKREWVTLAGIVLSRASTSAGQVDNHNKITSNGNSRSNATSGIVCAALATGVKCTPYEKTLKAQGTILHDLHAEILAIRGFNRWLVDECAVLARGGLHTRHDWLQWCIDQNCNEKLSQDHPGNSEIRELAQPFKLQDNVSLHMYISEAPCGDASMELVMAEQNDATPWLSSPTSSSENPDGLPGRGHFDLLGVVRRKPARADAPMVRSKSCSDKLALRQCTSLLSSLTAQLIQPENAYLSSLILPEKQFVQVAAKRAFGSQGRMAPILDTRTQDRWLRRGYSWKPFEVHTTEQKFGFSREAVAAQGMAPVPSNICMLATPARQEILIGGVLQGRKLFDPRGASCISRRRLWASVLEIAVLAGLQPLIAKLGGPGRIYADAKFDKNREAVKQDATTVALKGWTRSNGDDQWCLSAEENLP